MTPEEIGAFLKAWRVDRMKKGVRTVADELEISKVTVKNIEAGKNVGIHTIVRYCNYLGCEVDALPLLKV